MEKSTIGSGLTYIFVLCFASKRRSFRIKTRDMWVQGIGINRHILRWWLGCPITTETYSILVPVTFSEGDWILRVLKFTGVFVGIFVVYPPLMLRSFFKKSDYQNPCHVFYPSSLQSFAIILSASVHNCFLFGTMVFLSFFGKRWQQHEKTLPQTSQNTLGKESPC